MEPKQKITNVADEKKKNRASKEKQQQVASQLEEELKKERQERNLFQVERDQMKIFWDITKQELEEARAEIKNKERDMELETMRHKDMEQQLGQKTKDLLHEYQVNITEIARENLLNTNEKLREADEQKEIVLADKRHLKEKLFEQQLDHQVENQQLLLSFSQDLSKARKEFEETVRNLKRVCDNKMEKLRQELELRHTTELAEENARRKMFIENLTKNHEEVLTKMKNHIREVTKEKLSIISDLQDEIKESKRREAHMERKLAEIKKENQNIIVPMQEAVAESKRVQRKLATLEHHDGVLNYNKIILAEAHEKNRQLTVQNEALMMKIQFMEQEKELMERKHVSTILELSTSAATKKLLTFKQ